MTTGEHATWSGLPTEVVEQVLVHLDPQSLLALGKLNHYFNRLALETFFDHSLRLIRLNKLVPPFPHSESLMLSGFHLALWLVSVTELEQHIVGDVHECIRQFAKLILFVGRLHSLKSLKLRIVMLRSCWRWRDYKVEGETIVAELHQLMEIAMAKGCEKLQIEGNSPPHCRLSASGIRNLRTLDTATTKAWKWIRRRMTLPCISIPAGSSFYPSRDAQYFTSSSPTPEPHVTMCVLQRPALLGTAALPYIAKLFRQNAETITHLEINCFGLTRSHRKARALSLALLKVIQLPHLATLILHIQVSTISTSSLGQFFTRHPEISTLELYDPSTLPDQPSMIVTDHRSFTLPGLKVLRIPARVAEWLFASMMDTGHVLELVEIYAPGHPDSLEKLGDAVREFRRRRGQVQTLKLDANWWKYGTELSIIGSDCLGEQIDSSPLHVHKLVFSLESNPLWKSAYPVRLAEGLVHVMQLFPTVRELEISSRVFAGELEGAEELKKMIMVQCPNLLVLSVQH